jgi:hypothetical protein
VCLFVGNGFLFFDGYVVKLCGIKYFSALLALDELSIFVARDDFDDGVFAGGGHGWGGANGMDFARIERGCQPSFPLFSLVSGWFVSGRKIGKAGCVPVVPDVHYLGLELSAFWTISVLSGSSRVSDAASDQKSGLRSDGFEVPG